MQDLLSVYFLSFVHKNQLHILSIKKLYVKFQVWLIDICALFSRTSKFDSLPETDFFFLLYLLAIREGTRYIYPYKLMS